MQIEPASFVQVYRGTALSLPSSKRAFAHAKLASPMGCQQMLGLSQLSMVSIDKSRDGNLFSVSCCGRIISFFPFQFPHKGSSELLQAHRYNHGKKHSPLQSLIKHFPMFISENCKINVYGFYQIISEHKLSHFRFLQWKHIYLSLLKLCPFLEQV